MKKIIISLSLAFALMAPSLADTSVESSASSAQGNGAEGVRFVEAKAEVDRLRKDKPDSPEFHSAQMRLEMILNQAEVQQDQRAARAYYANWRNHQEELRKDAEAAAQATHHTGKQ